MSFGSQRVLFMGHMLRHFQVLPMQKLAEITLKIRPQLDSKYSTTTSNTK